MHSPMEEAPMTPDRTDAAALRKLCAEFARPCNRSAVLQLLNTVPAFFALWALMAFSTRWSLFAPLLLALPAAGLYVRIFIIQHDCGHGSYFSSPRLNDAVGRALGLLTLFPYGYWKKTHAVHHGTSGNLDRRELGDVTTLTVAEYEALPWHGRLGYRLYRSAPVLLGIGPMWQLLVKHRVPFDMPLSWKKEWASVLWNNLALLVVGGILVYAIGWRVVLAVHLPIVLIAGALGVWLFYVQHQFADAYWARGEQWDSSRAAVAGSSFYDLPQVIHWFTGNIGYHHIHHLATRIPNYRLRAAYRSSPLLRAAPKLTFIESLRCIRCKLWDEAQGRMVGFPKRKRARATA